MVVELWEWEWGRRALCAHRQSTLLKAATLSRKEITEGKNTPNIIFSFVCSKGGVQKNMDVVSSAPPSSAEVEEFVKDGIVGAMVKQCQQFAKRQQLPVHMLTNQEQQTGQRSHTGTTVAVVAPEHDVRQRTVTFRILGFTQRRIAEEFAVGLVQFKQEVSKYASVITYLHKEITSTDTGVELCVMFVYDHQRLYDTI
jgi:hypothetical protein